MLPIEQYGCIGDCRSAALVGANGSIEWLCWPNFDSDALFWSLLDERGGFWSVAPKGALDVWRKYLEHTNVLCTTFRTDTGLSRIFDFMPVANERDKARLLQPEREILRIVEGVEGSSELSMCLRARPDFGATKPTIRRLDRFRVRFTHRRRAWLLAADGELECCDNGDVIATLKVAPGQRLTLSLSYAEQGPLVFVPFADRSLTALSRTTQWWRSWVSRARYEGPHRELVLRSLLVLKLLTFAPSGAIVAACTTSLPERPAGELNWDYRYTWMRDAALTVRALLDLGYEEYASSFVGWLLHTTRLTRPELRVLYDVFGRTPQKERTLDALDGWYGAKPVRVGNGADRQLQLDGYGEVIDAVAQLVRRSHLRLDRETQRLLIQYGVNVCRRWREPDSGIWEVRGELRHYTHSKVLCWVALDRLLELHQNGCLPGVPQQHFEAERRAIELTIEERGYDEDLGSYTQILGEPQVDASLLQLAWYGYRPHESVRMQGTSRRILDDLQANGAFLYRNRQSLAHGEGAFGICSFWAVEFLARGGDIETASALFEQLVCQANDVGLFAEEFDPQQLTPLGNFPQAFTHVGLINAALALAEAMKPRSNPTSGVEGTR